MSAPVQSCQPIPEPVRQDAPTPKLVMGHIVYIGPDDEEGIPYDEAVIHLEGDEDSEIRINCPGAFRLAQVVVEAVNSHAALKAQIEQLESNAREQAKLLADTGRRVEEMGEALRTADKYLDNMGYGELTRARKTLRAALSSGEAVK